MNNITFPRLGLEFNIDPILLHYKNGGGIHLYGVIIAVGVLLALALCSAVYKSRGRSPEELLDFIIWALPLGIVGARAYYVIFSWEAYAGRPADIFKIWQGGLAVYGGIAAGLLTAVVFCAVKRLSFFEFADVAVLGLCVGQSLGRWGNFVNGEAHGGETSLPWGMSINGGPPVHPTFLYESLWSLLGLILLLLILRKQAFSGASFFTYFIWYGAGRFFIEGLRTDSLYTSMGLRASQLAAVISVAGGAAGLIWAKVMKMKSKNVKKL